MSAEKLALARFGLTGAVEIHARIVLWLMSVTLAVK